MLVRTPFRGAGVGEGLVHLAAERAAAAGARCLNLLVFEESRPAVGLYRKLGFRPDSIPRLAESLEEEVRRGGRRRLMMSRPV